MSEALLLGAIADDYTGAADLASMLREQGVRTGLLFGLGDDALLARLRGSYQAVVVALRSRSVLASEAVDASLRALGRLRELGARQVYFKYCSTFDSTAEGNIGPVTGALMEAMGVEFTVAVPALPVNGRTQYHGYLFVGDRLLSESHMRHHPVTPMTEPNLVRHLQAQTRRRVGLIAHPSVRSGAAAIRAEAARLRAEGAEIALVDALLDADLREIAEAVADLPLITGGSGLGIKLPGVWARRGLLPAEAAADVGARPSPVGALVLAGSCSAVTLEQLRVLQEAGGDGIRIDVLRLLASEAAELERLSSELSERVRRRGWALVYSSAGPEARARLLRAAGERGLSTAEVGHRLEHAAGELARRAVEAGVVGGVVVAGGETTGAVTQALAIRAVEIGPALDPGVPAARAIGGRPLDVVFKSGNFGSPDFFLRALRHLGVEPEARLR
jgi:uncharacterized protein YgbK (DUF1537 family)